MTPEDHAVVFSSDVGWICAAWRKGLLREMTFGHPSPDQAVRSLRHGDLAPTEPTGATRRFVHRLQKFLRHPDDDFMDIELDLSEYTKFQKRIVQKCREITIGKTLSYGELARQAGFPKAARATGQVMAGNRFPLIVPCHRVVGSGGTLGGFSAPNGLRLKQRLLALEKNATALAPVRSG